MHPTNIESCCLNDIPDAAFPEYVGRIFRGASRHYLLMPAFDGYYTLMTSDGDLAIYIDNFMGAEKRVRVNSGRPELEPEMLKEFFPDLRFLPEGRVDFSKKLEKSTLLTRNKWLKAIVSPEARDVPLGNLKCAEDLEWHYSHRNCSSFRIVYKGRTAEKAVLFAILFSCYRRAHRIGSIPEFESFGLYDPAGRRLLCGPVTPRYLARHFPDWCITERMRMRYFP